MCKKQTAVSHSSTESEIISLDTGLRIRWFAWSGIMGSNVFLSLEASLKIPIDQGNLIVMLRNIINLKGESM